MKLKKLTIMSFMTLLVLLSKQSFGGIIQYEFEQGGWVENHSTSSDWVTNGNAYGFFSGEDINNNGELELAELVSYGMSFSGNAQVDSFFHDLNDLMFFNYTIESVGFGIGVGSGNSHPLYSSNTLFNYDADDGFLSNASTGDFTFTFETAMVIEVTESNTVMLMTIAFFFILNRRFMITKP